MRKLGGIALIETVFLFFKLGWLGPSYVTKPIVRQSTAAMRYEALDVQNPPHLTRMIRPTTISKGTFRTFRTFLFDLSIFWGFGMTSEDALLHPVPMLQKYQPLLFVPKNSRFWRLLKRSLCHIHPSIHPSAYFPSQSLGIIVSSRSFFPSPKDSWKNDEKEHHAFQKKLEQAKKKCLYRCQHINERERKEEMKGPAEPTSQPVSQPPPSSTL